MTLDPDTPELAIHAFEKASGLIVTVHDRAGSIWPFLPPARFHHRGSFCAPVKGTGLDTRCVLFETERLRRELPAYPDGRIHVCHAGLVEWVTPVVRAGQTEWILFAGQRTSGDDLRPDVVDARTPPSDLPWPRTRKTPPPVDAGEAEVILELLRQLGARLLLWREGLERAGFFAGRSFTADRRLTILHFVEHRHIAAVQLADLAQHLHLSESRTSHLVRELFGKTFMELLAERRVRTAASLLRHSNLPVLQVASRAGFGDVSRFHRVFRRHTGTTPRQYRMNTT